MYNTHMAYVLELRKCCNFILERGSLTLHLLFIQYKSPQIVCSLDATMSC